MVHWAYHGTLQILHSLHAQDKCHTHVDTLEFFPFKMPLTKLSCGDAILHADNDLIHVLQNLNPFSPLHQLGDPQQNSLHELTTIFYNASLRLGIENNTSQHGQKQQPHQLKTTATHRFTIHHMTTCSQASKQQAHHVTQTMAVQPLLTHPELQCPDHAVINHAATIFHPTTSKVMTYHELITDQTTKQDWLLSANECIWLTCPRHQISCGMYPHNFLYPQTPGATQQKDHVCVLHM